MSNYVNLLDIVYPVGSMYFSTSSTSPSSIVGGTWELIENACISAAGDEFGSTDSIVGDGYLSGFNMPQHQHKIYAYNPMNATYYYPGFWTTNAASGTQWSFASYGNSLEPSRINLWAGSQDGDTAGDLWADAVYDKVKGDAKGTFMVSKKTREPFIPKHYNVFLYKRTA